MPMTQESKAILKKEISKMQVDKKKYQDELVTVTRDLERAKKRKAEIEAQIKIIDERTVNLKKDIDG